MRQRNFALSVLLSPEGVTDFCSVGLLSPTTPLNSILNTPLHSRVVKLLRISEEKVLLERSFHLKSEFDVKFEDPHTRNVVDKIMAMRFRQFKHRCHLHYKKFSPEEAPQHPPVNVEPVDWIPLCEHFKTDDFKKQSKAGKENRGDLEVNHTSGSKSFIQRLYEMENSESGEDLVTREEPSQLNLYKVTHLKKDGTWVHPQAAENHKKMEILKNQPVQEGSNKKTEDEVREDVLKTKIGYARGLGYGVKPSKSTSRGASARLLAQQLDEAGRHADASDKRAEESERRAE